MKAVSFSFQLSIVLRLKRTTAQKVKPAFVLRSKWLNIRNFMRDMLLVISSFLLQYSYGVRDGTDKENLASRETQRKTHLSVCDNVVLSISKLLLLVIDSFSRYLFDDFCKRHNLHRKLIGAEVGPYTGYNGGLNNSHMRRVNCQVYHFPLPV